MTYPMNDGGGWIVPASERIAAGSSIPAWSAIGPRCDIGPNYTIGEDCWIGANCTIGEGCKIGEGCTYAGVELDVVPADLAQRVLDAITERPEDWDQSNWHCGTQHCVAGWLELEAYGLQTLATAALAAHAWRIAYPGLRPPSFASEADRDEILALLRAAAESESEEVVQ